ncbi:acetyltransferase [Streptomyces abyssalis]|uniref:Acetyltransferase n=1 Tax=Streptomyces abyssalis TaxID=933944 RepID=A0A1E7JUD6_9ACTN|nr:GNAT family N-acetyltransferase [Streptomyces abyssalis]OEU88780.1 acetyltransferase [Streptomyces abyssalis]OEU93561.1 acetyltransferase [Streptomyces abyssalis]OEV32144.1 acetyltransferase [Streptomyces nanshensis]
MTTTLRPTGPDQYDADSVRSRSYDICVNSRPVGLLRLTVDPQYGPVTGRVTQLVVDERERRRGRGAVAALAAEEVLRDWGCRRVEITVPARAEAALGLVAGLGYRERSRSMIKQLGEEPRLPPGSTDRPMTEAEFPAWVAGGRPKLLRMFADRGVPDSELESRADESNRALLPAGVHTRGAVLRVLVHEGADVGSVWIETARSPRKDTDSYVYEVEVAEQQRGRGHGRSLMLIAERESLAAGARVLGLHVYCANTPALRLYSSLGYSAVEQHFYKPL